MNLTNSATPLLLERDLLRIVLELTSKKKISKLSGQSGRAAKIKKPSAHATHFQENSLGEFHRQIASFIAGQDRVQNTEIFSKFSTSTKRTLKRKLRDLIGAGSIKRLAEGKKVFYKIFDSK